jgi:hypothetical protein
MKNLLIALLILGLVIGFEFRLGSVSAQQVVIGEMSTYLGRVKGMNINSAGSDNSIPIGVPKYIVRRVIITNASTSLAVSVATIGVFTAASGGGTTIVTGATITGLTGATKFVDMTIAVNTDTVTAQTLFIRNILAHGSAATVDVYLFGEPLY